MPNHFSDGTLTRTTNAPAALAVVSNVQKPPIGRLKAKAT
jgi:hypothetical protein